MFLSPTNWRISNMTKLSGIPSGFGCAIREQLAWFSFLANRIHVHYERYLRRTANFTPDEPRMTQLQFAKNMLSNPVWMEGAREIYRLTKEL